MAKSVGKIAQIIGPVIAATAINLIVGVSTCKILERLPMFKKQLEPDNII